jgi:hypothetical protein
VKVAMSVALTAVLCMTPQMAAAQVADDGAFIVRIGSDTLSIERYTRTADRIVIDAVHRSPTVSVQQLVMTLDAHGAITGAEWTARPPGAAQPATRREFRFTGDSAVVATTQGGTTRTQTVAARDAVPLSGPFYTPYELLMMRAAASGGTASVELPLLSGANVVMIPLERVGTDSMVLQNQFGEPLRAHVDERGRLLHLRTPALTTVERVAALDFDRLAAEFARRDETGRGMGPLSVQRTYRTRVGQANIWVDYSRPAMRGRPVWGTLVPWNVVWRLGANDATHFSTDRALQLGDLALEPGTYTLFLLPTPDSLTLIVNRATGIGGLDHDPANDVGRVQLTVESIDNPVQLFTIDVAESQDGGRLVIAWDRLRGHVPIRVR